MSKSSGGLTRRHFLELVGVAGGSTAVYETMTAMGLINTPDAWAGPVQIPTATKNESVLILGAGIGGLTAAYELSRAGYTCTILEAQERAGGRNFTARAGSVVVEESSQGATRQICKFDPGLYLNMGPGRLPYHHRRVLHYCEVLNVPLEVYVMECTSALFQTDGFNGGRAIARRQISADTQGYIAELLAKAVSKSALDQELDEGDRDRLLCLLRNYGDLGERTLNDELGAAAIECPHCNNPSDTSCQQCVQSTGGCCAGCRECAKNKPQAFAYNGSTRAGCATPPDVLIGCRPPSKLMLKDLLGSEFWRFRFYQPLEFEWQPTLFQPIGGMDQIVEGFKRKVGRLINYQCEVKRIQLDKSGVRVTYRRGAAERQMRADYCISSIPLPILKSVTKEGFSQEYVDAVAKGKFAPTCKLGWQANERFWESNRYQIYGGISYTDDLITQMWYPSNDYFTSKGTLTGLYNYDACATQFGEMSLRRRIEVARKGAIKLHPEFANETTVPSDKAISIAWQNMKWERGGWAEWGQEDSKAYYRLLFPDGRFFVTGDQVSSLPGWQEGAMMSAERVVRQIAGVETALMKAAPINVVVPDTRRLVQGRH